MGYGVGAGASRCVVWWDFELMASAAECGDGYTVGTAIA